MALPAVIGQFDYGGVARNTDAIAHFEARNGRPCSDAAAASAFDGGDSIREHKLTALEPFEVLGLGRLDADERRNEASQ